MATGTIKKAAKQIEAGHDPGMDCFRGIITHLLANIIKDIPINNRWPSVLDPDLELALRRVQVSATEKRAALRIVWDAGIMTLSDIIGNIESKFPAQTFSAGKYAVEVAFIQEYIRGKSGLITICTKDHKNPMLLRHLNSPTVVLMPRIVSWPDEPPPEEGVTVAAGNGPSNKAAGNSPEEDESSEGDGEGAPEEAETTAT